MTQPFPLRYSLKRNENIRPFRDLNATFRSTFTLNSQELEMPKRPSNVNGLLNGDIQ